MEHGFCCNKCMHGGGHGPLCERVPFNPAPAWLEPSSYTRGKCKGGKPRSLFLLLRNFGPRSQITWHWGIGVGEDKKGTPQDIYDYPFGMYKHNDLATWDAYIKLPSSTSQSDEEIGKFLTTWQAEHPVYDAFFNNCQIFANSFHEFLSEEQLKYPRVGKAVGQGLLAGVKGVFQRGGKSMFRAFKDAAVEGAWEVEQNQPQNDTRAIWLRPGAKPKNPQRA